MQTVYNYGNLKWATKVIFFVVFCFFTACISLTSNVCANVVEVSEQEIFNYPPRTIIKENNMEWHLWYIHRGVPPYGMHGKLYINDLEVVGYELNEERKTEKNAYFWHGSFAKREHMWSDSGWLKYPFDQQATAKARLRGPRKGWSEHDHIYEPQRAIEEKDGDIFCRTYDMGRRDTAYYDLQVNGKWLGKGKDGEFAKSAFGEHRYKERPGNYIKADYGWLLIVPAKENKKDK